MMYNENYVESMHTIDVLSENYWLFLSWLLANVSFVPRVIGLLSTFIVAREERPFTVISLHHAILTM